MSKPIILLFAALGTSLLLAACEPEDPGAAGAAAAANGKPAKGDKPRPKGDMVAAVSAKPGTGIVELGFAIQKRPKVGEPVEIEFALTPSVDLEHMFARFQVADGLELVSGSETEHLEHPAKGVAVGHTITIRPKTDGIFYITAVVLADSEKESIARTFTVPLIAGQGLTELPAAPPAASTAEPSGAAPAR
jgi:hypothetical protein